MNSHPDLEALSAFVDGETGERDQIQSHLSGCPDCAGRLEAIRATINDLRLLSNPELDEKSSWSVRSALKQERTTRRDPRRMLLGISSAAAVLAIVAGFIAVAHNHSTHNSAPATSALLAGAFNVRTTNMNFTDASLAEELASFGKSTSSDSRANENMSAATPPRSPTKKLQALSIDLQSRIDQHATACFNSQIAPATNETFLVVQVLAALYKGDPVFIYFLEIPANKPVRIELWGLSRSTCSVEIFKQARI
ncbi:MAG: anti-sigma factor family protein [Actinomycetota bacterium]